MKKWMLSICLMFINEICHATDCFDLAGRDYKIDPDLLRAISWKESRYRVNAIGINPVTGYGQRTDAGRFPSILTNWPATELSQNI